MEQYEREFPEAVAANVAASIASGMRSTTDEDLFEDENGAHSRQSPNSSTRRTSSASASPVTAGYLPVPLTRDPVGGHLPLGNDFDARQCRYWAVDSGSGRRYGQRNAAGRLASAGILSLSVVN